MHAHVDRRAERQFRAPVQAPDLGERDARGVERLRHALTHMLLSTAGPIASSMAATSSRPMSAARDFSITARLATATAVLMFALIVVGSIVRTTGSGLACPDWPLCHGRLIPPFQFNIL